MRGAITRRCSDQFDEDFDIRDRVTTYSYLSRTLSCLMAPDIAARQRRCPPKTRVRSRLCRCGANDEHRGQYRCGKVRNLESGTEPSAIVGQPESSGDMIAKVA